MGLGAACFNAFSQTNEASSAYSFSLQQAVDFALQNQNNIKNALLDEEIAKNKVKEVFGMGLPQVNASFDVKKFLELPTSLIPTGRHAALG